VRSDIVAPAGGGSVNPRSVDSTASPIRCPRGNTWSWGCMRTSRPYVRPGTTRRVTDSEPRFCGSRQPRVTRGAG
jgi:hypothetical protein